jgi:hypothetical protein
MLKIHDRTCLILTTVESGPEHLVLTKSASQVYSSSVESDPHRYIRCSQKTSETTSFPTASRCGMTEHVRCYHRSVQSSIDSYKLVSNGSICNGGYICVCPKWPFEVRGSKGKVEGCYYTTFVLSTCIGLKDHLVTSVGCFAKCLG